MDDKRREISPDDYKRIRLYTLYLNQTNRETANSFGVSTKYVKKVLTGEAPMPSSYALTMDVFECSGCHRRFSQESDFLGHLDLWTSGGTKDLECWSVAPNHARLAELR